MSTKQTVKDNQSINDELNITQLCIDVLKKVSKRSKRANKSYMSGGEVEMMEDDFIKEEAEKVGLDYTKVYSMDIKILKKYLTI